MAHRTSAPGSIDNKFVDRNEALGREGTLVIADDKNAIQEEICNTIEAAGITLDSENDEQLKEAVVLKAGNVAETVTGVKTFSNIPVLPADDPTTANQATRKNYVDSSRDAAITTHNNVNNAHSATPNATASRLVVRDANARAKIADPSAADDIDTRGARDAAITTHNNVTSPHSATHLDTASRICLRDSNGRTRVKNPANQLDAANLGTVISTAISTVQGAFGGHIKQTAPVSFVILSFVAKHLFLASIAGKNLKLFINISLGSLYESSFFAFR